MGNPTALNFPWKSSRFKLQDPKPVAIARAARVATRGQFPASEKHANCSRSRGSFSRHVTHQGKNGHPGCFEGQGRVTMCEQASCCAYVWWHGNQVRSRGCAGLTGFPTLQLWEVQTMEPEGPLIDPEETKAKCLLCLWELLFNQPETCGNPKQVRPTVQERNSWNSHENHEP